MSRRLLDAKMMFTEMMYRGDKTAVYIFDGEYDEPVNLDLVNSCYEYARELGIEIEVEWREGNRLSIKIV